MVTGLWLQNLTIDRFRRKMLRTEKKVIVDHFTFNFKPRSEVAFLTRNAKNKGILGRDCGGYSGKCRV